MLRFEIKSIHSSSYYVEANGQVEVTNCIIDVIKKNIEEKPRK